MSCNQEFKLFYFYLGWSLTHGVFPSIKLCADILTRIYIYRKKLICTFLGMRISLRTDGSDVAVLCSNLVGTICGTGCLSLFGGFLIKFHVPVLYFNGGTFVLNIMEKAWCWILFAFAGTSIGARSHAFRRSKSNHFIWIWQESSDMIVTSGGTFYIFADSNIIRRNSSVYSTRGLRF